MAQKQSKQRLEEYCNTGLEFTTGVEGHSLFVLALRMDIGFTDQTQPTSVWSVVGSLPPLVAGPTHLNDLRLKFSSWLPPTMSNLQHSCPFLRFDRIWWISHFQIIKGPVPLGVFFCDCQNHWLTDQVTEKYVRCFFKCRYIFFVAAGFLNVQSFGDTDMTSAVAENNHHVGLALKASTTTQPISICMCECGAWDNNLLWPGMAAWALALMGSFTFYGRYSSNWPMFCHRPWF